MVVPDVLQTIAELTVTLAGFMSVIVVFSNKQVSGPELFFRIRWTFVQCMVVVVSVLLPYVLVGFSTASQVVWGIPLVFFGLANIGILILGMYGVEAGPVQTVSSATTYSVLIISIVITASLLLSGFDLLVPRIPEMLILGAIWSMCVGAWGFISSIERGLQE